MTMHAAPSIPSIDAWLRATAPRPRVDAVESEPHRGRVIQSRYRLSDVLGRGSFGTTYAADDLRTGKRVAVKELALRGVDDWKTIELFEREAKVLASLDHPQIPRYIEYIPVSDAPGFLVQELAPGRSLAARLAAGERWSERSVRDIITQLLDVLIYLSERLPPVVHRDVKPSNIIMDDAGRCYLVDFGAVRDALYASTTGGSTIAGTYGYMAPEQLHGRADASSDLYSLGATIVHLVTGVEPSELPRARLKLDVIHRLPLSSALAEFVDRLIEPVSDDRFPTPRAARDALGRCADAPVVVPNLELTERSIASAVERERREKQARARQERARVERRVREIANTARRRVSLTRDDDGLTIGIDRTPEYKERFSEAFRVSAPVSLIVLIPLAANLGNALSLPELVTLALFVIALALSFAIAGFIAARRVEKALCVRVIGGYFAAWDRDPNAPLAVGTLSDLAIHVAEPSSDGFGGAVLHLGGRQESTPKLGDHDVSLLRSVGAMIRDAENATAHAVKSTVRRPDGRTAGAAVATPRDRRAADGGLQPSHRDA